MAKHHNPDFTACIGKNDTFGMIYNSMLCHHKFQELKPRQQLFYVACRVQAKSSEGKKTLYKHGQEYGITYNEEDFVFPESHLKRYGYDSRNAYKYMKALCDAGFIKVKERNKVQWHVNVYSFSDDWKK